MSTTTKFVREAVRLLASPKLRAFARRFGAADVEDVLQDAALRICEVDRRGYEPTSIPALVFVIVQHAATDRLRKRKRDIAAIDPALAYGSHLLARAAGADLVDASGCDVEAEAADSIDRDLWLGWLAEAMTEIDPLKAEQVRLTYLDPTAPPVRERDVPFGTAVSRTARGKDDLRVRIEAKAKQHIERASDSLPEADAGPRQKLIDKCREHGFAVRKPEQMLLGVG